MKSIPIINAITKLFTIRISITQLKLFICIKQFLTPNIGTTCPFAVNMFWLCFINIPFVLFFKSMPIELTKVRLHPVTNKNVTGFPFILHIPVI